jgi:hypothetical protein
LRKINERTQNKQADQKRNQPPILLLAHKLANSLKNPAHGKNVRLDTHGCKRLGSGSAHSLSALSNQSPMAISSGRYEIQ